MPIGDILETDWLNNSDVKDLDFPSVFYLCSTAFWEFSIKQSSHEAHRTVIHISSVFQIFSTSDKELSQCPFMIMSFIHILFMRVYIMKCAKAYAVKISILQVRFIKEILKPCWAMRTLGEIFPYKGKNMLFKYTVSLIRSISNALQEKGHRKPFSRWIFYCRAPAI